MFAIYKKELKSYFLGMTGFVFVAFLLLMAGILVTAYNLLLAYASLAYAIGSIQVVLMLSVPILTMRILAEERKSRTDQLLFSLPIPTVQIVLAKYFAMLTVLAVPTAVIGCYPLLLSVFGSVPFLPSYAALLGFFLLGAALVALCMFLSALTDSQILAAVAGFGAVLGIYLLPTLATMIPRGAGASLLAFVLVEVLAAVVLYLLSGSILLSVLGGGLLLLPTVIVYLADPALFEGLFPDLLGRLALFSRFDRLVSGVFDLTAIVYFLSFTAFFVFLTVRAVEKRRFV